MFLQIGHSAFQSVLKHHCGYNSEVLLCNCPFCCMCGWNDPDLGAPGGDRLSPPGSPSHGCPERCSFLLKCLHLRGPAGSAHTLPRAWQGTTSSELHSVTLVCLLCGALTVRKASLSWSSFKSSLKCHFLQEALHDRLQITFPPAPLSALPGVCSVWLQDSPLSGAEFPENRTITFPSSALVCSRHRGSPMIGCSMMMAEWVIMTCLVFINRQIGSSA